jgi:hypothetical protein
MKRSLLLVSAVFAGGCCSGASGVQVAVSDIIPTVATVTWETCDDAVGYVQFGPGDDRSMSTALELEPGTSHTAQLLGVPANTDATFEIVLVDEDGTENPTGVHEYSTGGLPAGLPILEVTGSGMDHYMVLPMLGSPVGLVVLDGDGNFLWWHFEEDRGLDVYRARLSVDGESLLYNAASVSGDPSDESQIMRVSLDGSEVTAIDVPLLAHDFVEHADGTIGAMVIEYRDVDGEEIKGDSIVEIAPDGTQTTVWTSWDCFDVDEHEVNPVDAAYGWTFANALDYDGTYYYLSLRNFSTIVQIDPRDGSCGWAFGDIGATITPSGATRFMHEHQFEVLEDSILVFDNDGYVPTGGEQDHSRVLEYAFDPEAGTAELIWEYSTEPPVWSFVLGDVKRFDDGDTLVTWSVNGLIERVDADSQVEWSMATAFGSAFGFNTVREDLYAADDHL